MDFQRSFVDQYNFWRIAGVITMFAANVAMAQIKRPDTGESILKRNGLWMPFYIP
jgi:hypothetical protein